MNNKMYFEDIFIFVKFIILNKFIFILSILFLSIFSFYNYYTNYIKYLDGIYNEHLLEISASSNIINLSNKELVNIYQFYPYKSLWTNEKYNINNFYLKLDNVLTNYFDENGLSYETINTSSKKIIYRFNNSEYFPKLLNEKIILNYYELAKNEFVLNIQVGVDDVFESFLLETYIHFSKLRNTILRKGDFEKAREIYNRFGLKYIYNKLCHIDMARLAKVNNPNIHNDVSGLLENNCNINKKIKFDYNNTNICKIINMNLRVEDILNQYFMTNIECKEGVFPDEKAFQIANNYIEKIKNSNLIDIIFSTKTKYKFEKPKLIPYLLATILFSFFFSIIFIFLFRSKKSS